MVNLARMKRLSVGVGVDVAGETSVDLDGLQRDRAQVKQCGVAGAEVV